MTIFTLIIFVLIFSVLVLVHEYGHFLAAKRAGVSVMEFGLGLPPRIWGKKKHGTIWSFNWIPFGGFVRLKGEDGTRAQDPDSMVGKSYGQRILIITAGVLMNFGLAYALLMIGFWGGMSPLAANLQALTGAKFDSKVVVIDLVNGGPAKVAGLKPGDIILSVDGQSLQLATQLQTLIADKSVAHLVVERDEKEIKLNVPTKLENDKRMLGVLIDEAISNVSYVWWKVPYLALIDLLILVKQIGAALVAFVVHLATTASLQDSVSGPIGIAKVTSEAIKLGWMFTLQLVVFLSVNLGLINIAPFPALDGGRLVFVLIEMARGGKKISKEWENGIHSLGFLLLLALIFAVTYRDIVGLFSSA